MTVDQPVPGEPRPRVLVVDDDDAIRRMVKLTLAQRYEVFEASDAQEAIAMVEAHDIEVVVTDVTMPGMTGVEAMPLLRAKAKGPISVLLLTALGDQAHRNAALEAGADDYLAKPVDRRELLLRVQHFVRLGRQERTIRQQLGELSQLTALKDDLVALLVHDLRNPLTALRTAFQLIGPSIPAEDKRLFQLGESALKRVIDGVSDLLKVRMLERGELPLERTTFIGQDLVTEVVKTLEAAALGFKVSLDVQSGKPVKVNADHTLVTRAIENLVMNAVRHTKERVEISVANEDTRVVFTVADRGPGVPDFLKDELFDMFGSLALKNAGGRKGHGLGLYLVRLVARAHGGEVVVKDRDGGGARFVFSIPAGV
jgi:signal transduction histidine kinase